MFIFQKYRQFIHDRTQHQRNPCNFGNNSRDEDRGMMGEVVGMVASICKLHQVNPRSVYQSYLPELKELMNRGIGKSGFSDYFKQFSNN
ncbi:MAG: hypothetical protein LBV64_02090 [Mediterranea sp.]|jgi:hypothetical protein|nr:hypothetical protein [Mediterranea sp.]